MEIQVHTLVFDALSFMRDNAKVFRKYIFLPVVFSFASLFLVKVPNFGLALASVSNSLALALLGVSATRFYLMGKAEKVADGANRPFARFFFLTFFMTVLGHMAEVFTLLPKEFQGSMFLWMILGFWINLKICLAFPALAMDHPGSVWDNIRLSFNWTRGYGFKIVTAFLVCYCPVIFFTMTLMQIPALMPDEKDFWGSLPQLMFSDFLIVFSMLWSSLVLAKLYEGIALKGNSSI
ncbi:membrane hypothetical protein [Candidatus Terasakiella magnetica]|uniref:Uncharacterized protein n=1 Tax=Candidatus Terasakiella magnetica TaxID=1867952 RepID=A0A1C3RIJ7_9PROT|nr:hypothetical protein [Candidatus Terasakiella magnetica]SCA57083.1 membrane hypothetical protein [Candidatus Terasakiella magnetica]